MPELFRLLNRMNVGLGVIVTLGLALRLGFNLPEQTQNIIYWITLLISIVFVLQELYRFTLYKIKSIYLRERWFDFLLVASCSVLLAAHFGLFHSPLTQLQLNTAFSLLILAGLFTSLTTHLERGVSKSRLSLRPAQVFLLSFLAPIFIGALLLKMPNSTLIELSWIDAFFMATSAVCVTGLATVDLTQFTFLGQAIMLVLIQIGGLGIMTLTLAFASFISGGLGVKDRIMIGKMFSENKLSEVKGLLYRICLFTFSIEAVGAALLFVSLKDQVQFAEAEGVWISLFHSISAFCNAGFTILDSGLAHETLRFNYEFCFVIAILIILGGIGFPTLSNFQQYLLKVARKNRDYHLINITSKVIVNSTLGLLIFGTSAFLITEFLIKQQGLPSFDQLFQSFFWSVTARTAGFNILPVEELSQIGVLVLIFLMWIGGAPMSTAGGIKVTTFYLAYLNVKSQIFNLDHVEAFGRHIRDINISKAFGIMSLSLAFIFLSSFILVALEPQIEALDLLFEVVSAVSTVGLSRGITADLGDTSKLVLIILMFTGRLGLITVIAAFARPVTTVRYRYLEDDIVI